MNLTHLDENSQIKMVDITDKNITKREAKAECFVILKKEVLDSILNDKIAKGNVFTTAKLAGINAAKKTHEVIFLSHQLNLSVVDINIDIIDNKIKITSTCKTTYGTGIEMEALYSCLVSALNIYDMCKGVDKNIEITNANLISKSGGKSGDYRKKK
jgi:molybdenum cofactor biosynthesis protein MoaC